MTTFYTILRRNIVYFISYLFIFIVHRENIIHNLILYLIFIMKNKNIYVIGIK